MTGFLADTKPAPTLVNTIHLDVIEDIGQSGFYRHPLPVLSGFFGHIALEISGVRDHAGTQAGVGKRLPTNGPRLIIGARRVH